MAKPSISRRAALRGLGGVTVGLPLLEIMLDGRAAAQASRLPARFVVSFAGESTGWGQSQVDPTREGPDYDLTRASAPLGNYQNIKNEITIVTDLLIPWKVAGVVPAGGRELEFHDAALGIQMCGMRQTEGGSPVPRGTTCDQLVVDAQQAGTRFPSLQYRIQARAYRGSFEDQGTMSWRSSGGEVEPLRPIASPKVAYDSLFSGFAPADPAEVAKKQQLLAQDRSVLDLVKTRSERLWPLLGRPDQMRLERHFDEIRALEQRIREIPAVSQEAACTQLTDPGDDTPEEVIERGGGTIGWSDESRRGRVLCDLIHMALTCDLTRVASLVMTYCSSFLNAKAFAGVDLDVHSLSHGNVLNTGDTEHSDSIAWHWDHFAYLTAKLRDTPELDGTLLDRTVLVHLSEGGGGYDPADDNDGAAHSTEKMVVLVGGGRKLGLSPGRHLRGQKAHPAAVVLGAMQPFGVNAPFGDITQAFPNL